MHPLPLPQSPHRQTEDTHSVSLLSQVPLTPEQFALVSGKNGATARQIADESGAKLELNKYVFLPSSHVFKHLTLLVYPPIDHYRRLLTVGMHLLWDVIIGRRAW